MGIESVLSSIYHNSFNIKFAVISAGFNGPIAAAVNYNHSTLEMLTAGTTQAITSFISTGFTARLVQHFSPINNKLFSLSIAKPLGSSPGAIDQSFST